MMATRWGERYLIASNKYYLAQIYAATRRYELVPQAVEEARDIFQRLGRSEQQAEVEEFIQRMAKDIDVKPMQQN